jgi:BirA family transcriptional regulator, biotin operon repressor / biotin---[acetyl-CoA-carboxylase] ligase
MRPTGRGERLTDAEAPVLGHPRMHLRRTDSTNERARALAIAGAPTGTLVTAAEQTAGRGRQGRTWTAQANSALLCSLILREPPPLLSLIAGVAVCETVGERASVKWPNDIVVKPALAKLAGILVEGRPQEGWAVLGIGLNVAVRIEQLPSDLRGRAASLELPPSAIEPMVGRLMRALERRLAEPTKDVLDAWRGRDALMGRDVSWDRGQGVARGIDDVGRLIVTLADGSTTKLDAGEVHLGPTL